MRDNFIKHSHPSSRIISLLLVLVIVTVFWQVLNHEFVNFDDPVYVTENSYVQAGLKSESIVWAFTTMRGSFWIPLTWLSLMLDSQIYGLNPCGYHLTNLLLHVANTVLLFTALRRMTGAIWPSAFVAALFALHPLHVESVAWVTERKDVLSAFFWMLTMWAYACYAQRPAFSMYVLSFLFFALGLMSKPMLVTLPLVLLLLDYWPLGRFQVGKSGGVVGQKETIIRLILEKVPFLILAILSSLITLYAKQHCNTIQFLELLPLKLRVSNALVSYIGYIKKMIWPHNLTVLYPQPNILPMWESVVSGLLLVAVTILAIRMAHQHSYVAVGWLWYLGTLVPVIGLVQVGPFSMADRFTYIPMIGLFIVICWGVPAMLKGLRYQRLVLFVSTALILSTLAVCTYMQLQYWRSSITLFEHAVDVIPDNLLAHVNLGAALADAERIDEAIINYNEAIRIDSDYFLSHLNLGVALATKGRLDDAIVHYHTAICISPGFAGTYYNLGNALMLKDELDTAVFYYREALRIDPGFEDAQHNLRFVLDKLG